MNLIYVTYSTLRLHFCTFVTGNSKSGLNFLPTAPKLRATLATSDKSYKDHLIENVGAPIQFQPRNANQIKYYKESNRRICKDSLLALHEFAYMIAGFVWSITTFPDLVVVCGFKPLIDFILPLCANEPILLSYDTTFNLGDFYVSILCMQLPFLTSKPCIPLAFMIHERKFKWMHDHFFRLVRQNIPHLTDAVIAVDGEASISNAIRAGTDWKVTMCANHILRDIEFWLKKHSASAGEIPVYKSNVRELLHCHNASALSQKELNFKSCWSAAFVTYYTDHLADRVKFAYAGYLHTLHLNCETVTTNMSESMNAALKRMQRWTEVSADMMACTFYKLQLCSYTDLVRSVRGFGPMEFQPDVNKGWSFNFLM